MKRGTIGHAKTADLARRLKIERWGAVGILESLWHSVGQYTPRGDVGKLTDADIAFYVGWTGEPEALVAALIESRWLDRHPEHRLVVHDHFHHAEDAVHLSLARSGETFASGEVPKMTRMSVKERKERKAAYSNRSPNAHVRTENALESTPPSPPNPSQPKALAKPSPSHNQAIPSPAPEKKNGTLKSADVPIGSGGIGKEFKWDAYSLERYLISRGVNVRTAAELAPHAENVAGVNFDLELARINLDKSRKDKIGTFVGWIESAMGIKRDSAGSILAGVVRRIGA